MTSQSDDQRRYRSQMLKGSLELAVLLALRGVDRYGLEIVELLNERGGLGVSEGSIYPLLNRLRADGKVKSRWVERERGHALKYYELTPLGSEACDTLLDAWRAHVSGIERIEAGGGQ